MLSFPILASKIIALTVEISMIFQTLSTKMGRSTLTLAFKARSQIPRFCSSLLTMQKQIEMMNSVALSHHVLR